MAEMWDGPVPVKKVHKTIVYLINENNEKEKYATLDFLYDIDFRNCSAYKFMKNNSHVGEIEPEYGLQCAYHKIINYNDIIDSQGSVLRLITIQ